MAGGGIVAFAEGGDADDFDVEAYREQEAEDEYANSLSALVAAVQAAAEEGVSTRKKGKKYADGGIARLNDGGAIRFQSRGAVVDPDQDPRIVALRQDPAYLAFAENGGIEGDTSLTAFLEAGNAAPVTAGGPEYEPAPATSPAGDFAKSVFDNVKKGFKARPNQEQRNEMREIGVQSGIFGIGTDESRAQADKALREKLYGPEGKPTITMPELGPTTSQTAPQVVSQVQKFPNEFPEEAASPSAGVAALPSAKLAPTGTPGAPKTAQVGTPSALQGSVVPMSQGADQAGKPRSAYDDFLDEIRAGREDLKTQAQKDKYMAIISAGLGMMSGTSPNAFANIGQGAQAGVASYMASGKQRAAEKAALNKNLLMGRRYQSMEDIANRTADINERRIAAIAAARGSGGDSKSEAQLDRQENAFTTRLRNAQATVLSALQAKFGKDGALIDPKGYAKAEQELTQKYVAPVMTMQERFLAKRYPDVFGDQAEMPDSGSVSTRLKVDKNGNIIQ
jgi:hypothetical protein